jgi:hypothetical protein
VATARTSTGSVLALGAFLVTALAACSMIGMTTIHPTPTPSRGHAGSAIRLGCPQLWTAQQSYDYNPMFALVGDDVDMMPMQRSCTWASESNGDTIVIELSSPGAAALAELAAGARAAGTPLAGIPSSRSYFVASTGEADVAFDGYWLEVRSPYFSAGADALPVASTVVANLRAAHSGRN